MIVKYLWIAGSLPFMLLGTIHLLYTFFSKKLSARDAALNEAMKNIHPVITRQTTMARAWTGFNASHSSGAIYIGIINTILAVEFPSVLQHPVVMLLNVSTVLFYLWLSKKYWFSTPFKGMMIAALGFIAATVITLFG